MRIADCCPTAGICGGCPWFQDDYAKQLQRKKQALDCAFTTDITIIPCPEIFRYRNRLDLAFGPRGELGLKKAGCWDQITDLKHCYLVSEKANEAIQCLRNWAKSSDLPGWDQKTGKGTLRYGVIREGRNTDELLIMIVAATGPDSQNIISLKQALADKVTGLVWGINAEKSDVSRAGSLIPIIGNPWLHETINGFRYRVHPHSFFQTNSLMAAKLQDVVREFCGNLTGKTLLDLFCGAGFFSVALAKTCNRVIGVELDPIAIAAARVNAQLNEIDQIEFHVSEVGKFTWSDLKPETVIVDPPRSGLQYQVLDALRAALPKRIVYVSCNYERFLKELPALARHYEITKMTALDLFPHTPHVELVTLLEQKNKL